MWKVAAIGVDKNMLMHTEFRKCVYYSPVLRFCFLLSRDLLRCLIFSILAFASSLDETWLFPGIGSTTFTTQRSTSALFGKHLAMKSHPVNHGMLKVIKHVYTYSIKRTVYIVLYSPQKHHHS